MDARWYDSVMPISGATFPHDDTLGGTTSPQPVSLNPLSGIGSLFFGTRFIAIALGLIFIAGAILLFTGEDIGGALNRLPEVAA